MEDRQRESGRSKTSTQNTGSGDACDICGATDSLSVYSLETSPSEEETILLCPRHYRIAAILSGETHQRSEHMNQELQETRKITVRVPKALIEAADAAAEEEEQTRSEFVRDGLELSIAIQETDDAFDEILARAVRSDSTEDEDVAEDSVSDTEFLKERIRTLESLLEDSIDKI